MVEHLLESQHTSAQLPALAQLAEVVWRLASCLQLPQLQFCKVEWLALGHQDSAAMPVSDCFMHIQCQNEAVLQGCIYLFDIQTCYTIASSNVAFLATKDN